MGREYAASMNIKDEKIIDKIKSCIFLDPRFENASEEDLKYEADYDTHYIDLAKLFGLRDTLFTEETEEEREMSESEFAKIKRIAEWKNTRCVYGYMYDYDSTKGFGTFVVAGWNGFPEGVLKFLSKMTPSEEYNVCVRWDTWDDDDPGVEDYKLIDGIYTEVYSYETNEWTLLDKPVEDAITFDSAMELAYAEKYEEAIEQLLIVVKSGNKDAMNNLGVCYERIENYKEALKWYKRSSIDLARINALKIYRFRDVVFDFEDYNKIVNTLIKNKVEEGYVELAQLYSDGIKVEKDEKKAFELLNECIIKINNAHLAKNNLAYYYNNAIGCDFEFEKSHKLYEEIIGHNYDESANAEYNYGLQCRQGIGCEKDVKLAIKWLTHAYKNGYDKAKDELIDLYTNEEGFINKRMADRLKGNNTSTKYDETLHEENCIEKKAVCSSDNDFDYDDDYEYDEEFESNYDDKSYYLWEKK